MYFYSLNVFVQNNNLSTLACNAITYTSLYTHALFDRARQKKCQSSVPLVSVLQTYLPIKKEIYPGEHSMCLYKMGGCFLLMCGLEIGLGDR